MYKQICELDTDKLRNFCIKNIFYTQGDCVAYGNMFELARKYQGGIEILEMVAEDIYEHSSVDSLDTFCCYSCDSKKEMVSMIMGEIYRLCVSVWFE